ncbi:cation transporter [Aerococcus loyolae]|nr:cation transporter [Aerococcus loyolae]PKZ03511.1 cation transporter [Aerococcus loyolae]
MIGYHKESENMETLYRIVGIESQRQYDWLAQQIKDLNQDKGFAIQLDQDIVRLNRQEELLYLRRFLAFEQFSLVPLDSEGQLDENKRLQFRNSQETAKKMRLVLFLNAFFTVFEAFFGWTLNSAAILSDAIHDSGDVLAIAIAWFFEKISGREADNRYSYGYRRFSLLGGLITAVFLLIGSAFILVTSIPKLFNPEPIHVTGMFWVAVFAVVVNGYCSWMMHKGQSANEQLLNLHLLEDVLGWVAILILSVILRFTNWYFLDPLLSILTAAWIISQSFPRFLNISKIFLQAVPEGIDAQAIGQQILDLDEDIDGLSHLHIWSTDGEQHMASVTVLTCRLTADEQEELKQKIRSLVAKYNINHITIDTVYDPDHSIQRESSQRN